MRACAAQGLAGRPEQKQGPQLQASSYFSREPAKQWVQSFLSWQSGRLLSKHGCCVALKKIPLNKNLRRTCAVGTLFHPKPHVVLGDLNSRGSYDPPVASLNEGLSIAHVDYEPYPLLHTPTCLRVKRGQPGEHSSP